MSARRGRAGKGAGEGEGESRTLRVTSSLKGETAEAPTKANDDDDDDDELQQPLEVAVAQTDSHTHTNRDKRHSSSSSETVIAAAYILVFYPILLQFATRPLSPVFSPAAGKASKQGAFALDLHSSRSPTGWALVIAAFPFHRASCVCLPGTRVHQGPQVTRRQLCKVRRNDPSTGSARSWQSTSSFSTPCPSRPSETRHRAGALVRLRTSRCLLAHPWNH